MGRWACLLLSLAGCAAVETMETPPAAPEHVAGGEAVAEPATPAASPSPGGPAAASGSSGAASAGPLTAIVVRRGGEGDNEGPDAITRDAPRPLLIYTAALSMTVDEGEVVTTIDRIIEAAVQIGGYLASRDNHSVQVRIPSASFREGLSAFEQMGEVTNRSVTAQDVTEEYHDAEVRLQNLRATRDRLEQFLARAQNIDEVMRVHAELERISREMDTIEGRLRFLRARVAFSLVTVTLTARPVVVVQVEPAEPALPPPAQRPDLPFEWLGEMGIDRLMNLREE